MISMRPITGALAAIRRLRDDRGVAAIEAAAALPFIVALGAGVFEFGSLFYNMELMQTGVRDAARYLARAASPIAAETVAKNLAVTGSVTGTASPRVAWWQASHIQVTYRTTPNPVDPNTGSRLYRGGNPLTVIHVATTVDYGGQGLLAMMKLGPIRVSAAHEERYVGQ